MVCFNGSANRSAMEQFDILSFFFITSINFFLGLVLLVINSFLYFQKRVVLFISWAVVFFRAKLFEQLHTILKNNLKVKKQIFLCWFVLLSLFILVANLTGLIPNSYAITSSLAITLFLAFSYFLAFILIGISLHNWFFFNSFLPEGSPVATIFFLPLIELISFCARPFSLAVRLFANILSGHALMLILAGFSLIGLGFKFFLFKLLIPMAVISLSLAITFLECVIGLMQTFVFSILSSIYLNDHINLH